MQYVDLSLSSVSVLFFVMISSTMTVSTVGIVLSPMTMSIMSMAVTVIVVSSRCDGNLEVVPCEIREHTVLDVASEVSLLRERISVLLGVHSPSIEFKLERCTHLMFLLKKRGRLSRTAIFSSK